MKKNLLIDANVIFFEEQNEKKLFFVAFPNFVKKRCIIPFFEKKDYRFIDELIGEIHLSRELIHKCMECDSNYAAAANNIFFYKNVFLLKVGFQKQGIHYTRYVLTSKKLNETEIIDQIYQLYSSIEKILVSNYIG
ncbi:MAG: hypothetical protein ACLRPU_00365, partial [Enterococcus hulanensis]